MTTPTLEERAREIACSDVFCAAAMGKTDHHCRYCDDLTNAILTALKAEYGRGFAEGRQSGAAAIAERTEYERGQRDMRDRMRAVLRARGEAGHKLLEEVIAALPITHDSEKEGGG